MEGVDDTDKHKFGWGFSVQIRTGMGLCEKRRENGSTEIGSSFKEASISGHLLIYQP